MNRRRTFDELTFNDDWMFKTVMSDPNNIDIVKEIAERCIQRKIQDIRAIEQEKTENPEYYSHGTRFDVMFEGDEFYCVIEMQTYKDDLLLRSKYYHDVMDMMHFKPGSDYGNMRETYVIFLLSKDILKADLAVYTAKTRIIERPELKYEDKRTTIYINPQAQSEDDKIRALCIYLKDGSITDPLSEKISKAIETIKKNGIKRREFMSLDEWIEHEKKLGREEGREEGRELGRKEGIKEGIQEGKSTGQLEEKKAIALRMLMKDIADKDILDITELTVRQLDEIKEKMHISYE